MEVHHPHHPMHKKKWSEYILEFIMLFAAVTLGFFAENLREHYVEKHKAIVSVQNLYKDLKQDSISYLYGLNERRKQDSTFIIINNLYEKKSITNEIPSVYIAHSYLTIRTMPIMNSMALDQIKNSGTLNFIENEDLKKAIQSYASDGDGLKLREQREFGFIDRNLDSITISRFKYKIYQEICLKDEIEIINNTFPIGVRIPEGLKLNKQNTFDWDKYFSILSMLRTIRNSTDRIFILPTQNKCYKLMELVRNYLKENNSMIEE